MDSGLSGSEASLSSSPTLPSPTVKSSPESSPSTTTTTSPYVSAPSSPAKPVFMECEITAGDRQECVAGTKEEAPCSVGARPRTQYQNTPPNRTPQTPRQDANRSGGRHRSALKKQGKVASAMVAAAACQSQVKGATGVVCVEGKEVNPVKSVVKQCEVLGVWQACTVLPPQPSLKAEVLPDEVLQHLSSASKVNAHHHQGTREASFLVAGSVARLLHEIIEGKLQNGLALMQSVDDQASGTAMAVHSVLGSHGKTRVLIVDWGSCGGLGMECMFMDNPQVLVFSMQQCQRNSGSMPKDKERCSSNLRIDLNYNVTENISDYYTLAHQVVLPVAYEFRPEVVVMTAACEWNSHPAFLSHMAGLLMPVAGGRLVMGVEVDQQGSEGGGEAVVGALCTLLGRSPRPTMSMLSTSPSPQMCHTILEVMQAQQGNWKSLTHHALASFVTCTGNQKPSPSKPQHKHTNNTQEDASTPFKGSTHSYVSIVCHICKYIHTHIYKFVRFFLMCEYSRIQPLYSLRVVKGDQ